jgi:hypothetical protein
MTKYSKTLSALSVSALMLAGTASISYADGHGERMNVPKIETTEFMTGLENPWDMSGRWHHVLYGKVCGPFGTRDVWRC